MDGDRFEGSDEGTDEFTTLPILEDAAAAGVPRVVRDEQIVGRAVVHRRWLRGGEDHYVCLLVAGDSMAPILTDGAVVCVDLRDSDPERLVGRMVAAAVDGGVTVKWLRRGQGGGWLLMPENRDHDPIHLNDDGLRIVGRVAFWWCRAS